VPTVQLALSAARLRGIRAGSAPGAPGRTSHNPPVVGSSPTRPTCDLLESWSSRGPMSVVRLHRAAVMRSTPTGHVEQLLSGSLSAAPTAKAPYAIFTESCSDQSTRPSAANGPTETRPSRPSLQPPAVRPSWLPRPSGSCAAGNRNLRPPDCDDITTVKITDVPTARMEAGDPESTALVAHWVSHGQGLCDRR
jgi:hypothetical protein